MKNLFLFVIIIWTSLLYSQPSKDVLVFEDGIDALRRGPLGGDVGAETEYHYLPEAAPRGAWAVSTFRWNLTNSWFVRNIDSGRAIYQQQTNEETFWHPILIAGEFLWRNYTVKASFRPDSPDHQSGIIFRYHNDRCYYVLCVENNKMRIKLVHHAKSFHTLDERFLAEQDFLFKPGDWLQAIIHVQGNQIQAQLNNGVTLSAVDSMFTQGKIGLLADAPTAFRSIQVFMTPEDFASFKDEKAQQERIERDLQRSNPKMVLWKKISTEGFGVGRNLRFGDLNNDGTMDVLIGQVVHHGPKDANSELSCLTAMTFEGKILWQIGKPDPWKTYLTNDVAFQIHDIDHDGKNEVVYCMNLEFIIADGATGKTKYKSPTPLTPGGAPTPAGHNIYSRILGDCLFFCDLQGKGYDGDILLKDRYKYLWTFDGRLRPLWSAECVTGHYPYAYDVDGDGKDEIMMGYTLFDDDGKKLWSLDTTLKDHADGVAVLKFRDDMPPRILCAASDEGMAFFDLKGNIIKHLFIGHVQNPAAANFRDDLPGLEAVSVNFWSNQGIIHLYDADGNVYHDFEPNQYGSMCLPLNWTGKSEEYFVLNANVDEGGVYDGWGRKVLEFPDDGHPDMCNAVLDITGDCRDEIVVWDPHEIWVYTQNDNPKNGKLYAPKRNPLYNYSNYQATVSLPGWSE